MKRKVYLDGELGEKYGRELTIVADSFADVFRCLEANYPDIRQYLMDCHEKDIGFLCEIADKPLTTEEELLLSYPEGSMYISPQPMGSKGGMGKLFAALAIVVITAGIGALAISGSWAALGLNISQFGLGTMLSWGLSAAAGSTLGLIALGVAVNLALAGIQQLMAPDPATDAQQDESYLFQGSGQTIVEGDPVPILYGKLRVPGRPISFAIQNASQSFNNVNSFSGRNTTPSDTSPGEPDIDEGNDRPAYDDDRLDYPTNESPRGGYSGIGSRHIVIQGTD